MHVLVCAKRVLDPDGVNGYALWGRLKVDESGRSFDTGGTVPRIINAYDEQALEAALRLRDAGVDCRITALTVGGEDAGEILKRCVAMGADRAIHVFDAEAQTDGFRVARIVAALVGELADVDLVLCGRQGSDYDQGAMPGALAEWLGASLVTMASGVAAEPGTDGAVRVTRAVPNGEEMVRAQLPAVVSVSNELGQPRYPSSRGMLAARRTPPERREATEFVEAGETATVELVQLIVPDVQGQCEVIEGEDVRTKAAGLMARLRERGLLNV
ncbi:MAG: electron transfer flavoprotein subunit beta/FixA family protein [Chloroflexi bacterium]|nr:electron transfer flavoprotein subunit beta/FixA family protein [Chloroflexota bacterium]